MLIRTLAAVAALAVAAPALAHEPHHVNLGDPLPAGCTRVHIPTPSGKIVHAPAPVRCDKKVEIAKRDQAPARPAATPVAKD